MKISQSLKHDFYTLVAPSAAEAAISKWRRMCCKINVKLRNWSDFAPKQKNLKPECIAISSVLCHLFYSDFCTSLPAFTSVRLLFCSFCESNQIGLQQKRGKQKKNDGILLEGSQYLSSTENYVKTFAIMIVAILWRVCVVLFTVLFTWCCACHCLAVVGSLCNSWSGIGPDL